MVNVVDRTLCCGCGACEQICPKHCVQMVADEEGFLYPKVDQEKCIKCGLCEKICSFKKSRRTIKPLNVFAAINNDKSVRAISSSGGVFGAIAKKILEDGGLVFGAAFDDDWTVCITFVDNVRELHKLQGAKYVQARVGNSYLKCESFLKKGRTVLFSGTPCQISGLKHYLRDEYDNLITCEVVCHGTPSPQVWKNFLKDCFGNSKDIFCISFRDKRSGWKEYSFSLKGKKDISSPYKEVSYMRAFLWDLILRPSCYHCKMKSGRSLADITLGDFWGIEKIKPELDDDKGVSLVLINSVKGGALLKKLSSIETYEATYEAAVKYNPAICFSVKPHPRREYFFKKMNDVDFNRLVNECLRNKAFDKIKYNLKRIVSFFKGTNHL